MQPLSTTRNKLKAERTRHLALAVWLALAALALGIAARAQTASCPAHKALTLDQVLGFIQQHIPEERTLQFLDSCNVGFPMSVPTLEKLVQAGASENILDSLNRLTADRLSLDQAKAEVAQFQQKIPALEKTVDAERDQAQQRLDSEYQSQRVKQAKVDPQGPFEPTADYNLRNEQGQAALAALDRKHEDDRVQLASQYLAKAKEKSKPYRRRVAFLEACNYLDPRPLTYSHYDPDTGQLTATIGSENYSFDKVTPKTAETLFNRWKQVKARQPYAEGMDRPRVLSLDAISVPGYSARERKNRLEQQEAVSRAWEVYARTQKARLYLSSREYDRYSLALTEYRAILSLEPSNAEAIQEIALLQARQDRGTAGFRRLGRARRSAHVGPARQRIAHRLEGRKALLPRIFRWRFPGLAIAHRR